MTRASLKQKLNTSIVLFILLSILGGFLLKTNPAQAQAEMMGREVCTSITNCKEAINTFIKRMQTIAATLDGIAADQNDPRRTQAATDSEKIQKLIEDTQKELTAANTLRELQFAAEKAQQNYYEARAILRTGYEQEAEEIIKSVEGKGPAWWYYIAHPFELVLVGIGAILTLFITLLADIVMLLASAVKPILGWTDFTGNPVVEQGWRIVRDVANMFFSLILLIIAFATILRRESYGMKALLPKLVLAALLINFSLLVATPFLDFSNVLTNYFVDAATLEGKTFSESIADFAQIVNIFRTKEDSPIPQGTPALITILLGQIGGIFYALATIFVFAALLILLIIRIVFIWFLLILAPAAWLLWILPATSNLFRRWWSTFLKWCFFAPIFAFFLYLALSTRGVLKNEITRRITEDPSKALSVIFSTDVLIPMFITFGLLIGGLIAAQKMGIYGASGFIKVGTNLNRSVGRSIDRWLAKGAEKEGFKGMPRRALSYLSPTAWKMAWAERKKEKEREAFPIASGKRQDLLNRLVTWKSLSPAQLLRGRIGAGERTDFAERARRRREQEEMKDIFTKNSEERITAFMEAFRTKDVHKMAAYAKALAEENDINELLNHFGKINKTSKYKFGQQGFKNFVDDILKPVMGQQDAFRLAHDINRIEEGTGNWNLTRKYYFDPNKEKWTEVDNETAANESFVQWSKQDPQVQARNTGRLSVIEEGWDPETGTVRDFGLTPLGKKIAGALQPRHVSRLFSQTMAVIMGRHSEEIKTINKALRDALIQENQLDKMSPEQVVEFISKLQSSTNPVASGVPESHYELPQQPEPETEQERQ